MGLTLSCASVIAKIKNKNNGRVVCLGVPTTFITKKDLVNYISDIYPEINLKVFSGLKDNDTITTKDFFICLGYKEVVSIDISNYEGAEYILDLNNDKVPDDLKESADLIYDSGTLEHIFNLPNALKIIHNTLKVNGTVLHVNPSNQHLDHGLYQICPTYYRSYYDAANYDHVFVGLSNNFTSVFNLVEIDRYKFDIYRKNGGYKYTKNLKPYYLYYAAMKKKNSYIPKTVIQHYYSSKNINKEYNYINFKSDKFILKRKGMDIIKRIIQSLPFFVYLYRLLK